MPTDTSLVTPRRSFLGRLAAATAALGLATPTALRADSSPLESAEDEPWMKKLSGTQRVIFHAHEPTGGLSIRWAQTFLDTH